VKQTRPRTVASILRPIGVCVHINRLNSVMVKSASATTCHSVSPRAQRPQPMCCSARRRCGRMKRRRHALSPIG